MLKDNRVYFIKVRVSLFIVLKPTSIGVHKNHVQFHPSIRSNYTWSDKSGQKC